ncbi:MAG: PIN domain-containing protein [Bryobacteraceae bacterium]
MLDTNIVSILFKPDHSLHHKCFDVVSGHQWFVSFMTRAELLLWPRLNNWGTRRRENLSHHIDLCTTLLPDEETCRHWSDIVAESQSAGRPITTADGWIAAAARQWRLALVTADYRDYEHIEDLILIPME